MLPELEGIQLLTGYDRKDKPHLAVEDFHEAD